MKNLSALLVFFILSLSSFAQVEIRPFLGANFSNVRDAPNNTDTQARLGGQVGAHVLIGNKFHLYPGIGFFSRSTEFSTENDVNIDQTVDGVIIPILVGYRFVDASDEPLLNFRVFAGPSLMFLTKTEYDDGVLDENVDWNENQWGAQIGAGLDVSIFFLDVGYEFGLTNTNEGIKEAEGFFSDFDEIKQNTFFVNLGVRLSFSR